MCCRFLALVVVLPLLVAGCNKSQKQAEINSTPTRATDKFDSAGYSNAWGVDNSHAGSG